MKWKANELPDQKYLHEMFIEHDGILSALAVPGLGVVDGLC